MSAPVDGEAVAQPPLPLSAPGFWRRLAAMLYEGVVLFGVISVAGFLYSSLTQQRHALEGRAGLQAFLFVLLGLYFVWFWSRGGQTVAMKTWHLRLVDTHGGPVTQRRAVARYIGSWLWFLPGLSAAALAGWHSGAALSLAALAWALAYATLSHFLPARQTPHDLLCGTRLIVSKPAPKR